MDFARLIRAERQKRGVSLRELSKMTGITFVTLHNWEKTGMASMRVDHLDKALKALGLSVTIGAESEVE